MDFRTWAMIAGQGSMRDDSRGFEGDHLDFASNVLHDTRAFRMDDDVDSRYGQVLMQRYLQHQQGRQHELHADLAVRRPSNYQNVDMYAREMQRQYPLDDVRGDLVRRVPRSMQSSLSPVAFDEGSTRETEQSPASFIQTRHLYSPTVGLRVDESPLEPAMLEMYPNDRNTIPFPTAQVREKYRSLPPARALCNDLDPQLVHQQRQQPMPRRMHTSVRVNEERFTSERHEMDVRPGTKARHEQLARKPIRAYKTTELAIGDRIEREVRPNRVRLNEVSPRDARTRKFEYLGTRESMQPASVASTSWEGKEEETPLKRRCGRKCMNFSSEQKRERNRAAVKKCRQRQALKLEYVHRKATSLAAENEALSRLLVQKTVLGTAQRMSLTRGLQMDILLKLKEIFTQSLPKDFVLDAASIWDLNSVLAVSMPSRCYYGIESIQDFWRTSLRMRNKGKIRSFWGWLFRLPPGDRFTEFDIQPFSPSSKLYLISWTTNSTPGLAGSMVIMFGTSHRVALHVECFGWLIWRYLLTNEPFPETSIE